MTNITDTLRAYFEGENPFGGFGLAQMEKGYEWPINKAIRSEVPVIPDDDKYEANVALKLAMSERWRKERSPKGRENLTCLIIKDWGGIRGNSPERISAYAAEASKEDPAFRFKGIASFSKVLAIRDPEVYAIYDARVAVALNAIHIIGKPETGQLFPYLPGRNNVTGVTGKKRGFSTLPKHSPEKLGQLHPGSRWDIVPPEMAYQSYLDLLNSVFEMLSKKSVEVKIYDLEMCLFSQAEQLAILAAPELKPIEKDCR